MLGAILKQLVSTRGIPENVRQTFRKFSYRGPRLPDIVGMLKTTVSLVSRVYICIDALDECTPKSRQDLFGSLCDIVRESPGTRVLITRRPHAEEEVKKYFTDVITVPVSLTAGDIRAYLDARLNGDPEPYAVDDDLRRDIMRIIPEMISEV